METARKETTNRWVVMAACILAMLSIANLQYAWTFFTNPLTKSLNASLAAVQVAFSVFVIGMTWLQPIEAWLVDKLGARTMVAIGAVLVAVAWIGSGLAQSLTMLYISQGIGGLGAGITYGACIGMMTKWFPDRRGLAVGLAAGAFGFGTALTVIPIQMMIASSGYTATFITFGLIQGAVVLLAAQFMKFPVQGWKPAGWVPKASSKVIQSQRDYEPQDMVKTGTFYVMYLMMTMVASGGLMVTAQMHPIAKTYGYDKVVLFASVTVFSFAVILEQIANGVTRPFWGWISDQIGRYNTMGIAFSLEALGLILLTIFVQGHPYLFIVLSSMTFFAWGELYSLFPTAVADIFGSRYSTANYGLLYTSKGVASLLAGPGAAALMAVTGSWRPVLLTGAVSDIIVASLAVFWLRPHVAAMVKKSSLTPVPAAQAAGGEH